MLKVWGRRSAFNVQKTMWAIGELELAHQHIEVGGDTGGLDTPEFLARNPHGRIPVIEDDGFVVWESNSIIRYLFAKYASDTIWAGDPANRSQQDRWLDWGLATAQRDFLDLFWGYYRTPEANRNAAFVDERLKRCAANYTLLDRHLETNVFLGGNAFSMADIPTGTTLFRYFGMGIEPPSIPNVRSWYSRLWERAAYREHVMIPFDNLYGKLAY